MQRSTQSSKCVGTGKNSFKHLLSEPWGKEQKCANFLMAMEPDHWREFMPKSIPEHPAGFDEQYEIYSKIPVYEKDRRSKAWLELYREFPGYFKARTEAELKNASDIAFLRDMLAFFESESMVSYAMKVREKINEYRCPL